MPTILARLLPHGRQRPGLVPREALWQAAGPDFPIHTEMKRCASAMMRLKHHAGETPSVEQTKRLSPRAVQNPKTGKPFDDKILRKVFTEDCYDLDPEHPWRFQPRLRNAS